MPESKREPSEVHLLRDPLDVENSVDHEGLVVHYDLVALAVEFAALSRAAGRRPLDEAATKRWEALRGALIRLGHEEELAQLSHGPRVAS